MPIKTYQLGPGRLELGAAPYNASAQVRSCRITSSETVTSVAAIPVLSGEELPETSSQTIAQTITGSFLQDLDLNGLVDWTWDNAATEQPFTFVPNNVLDRAWSGVLIPIPLDVGGDVQRPGEQGEPPSADFTWRIVGMATRGDATP